MGESLDFIVAISWQLIALVGILFLRKELREAFGRLKQAKIPGGTELSFVQRPILPREETPAITGPTSALEGEWNNVGNVYWLGSDLIWTISAFLGGARKPELMYGLVQSLHHLKCLKLDGGKLESRLARMVTKLEGLNESELNPEMRLTFVDDLDVFKNEVGAYVALKQPDFEGFPK